MSSKSDAKRQPMDEDDVKEFNGVFKNSHLKEKRRKRVRNIWDEFIAQSTLHGLHYVFERRPFPQRFVWLVLQGFMIGLFMWQTLTLVLAYFDYNVSSTIELITERESNFPAVTLCNFNKYRKSVIRKSDFYDALIEKNPLYKKDLKSFNWTKYDSLNDLNMKEFIHKAGHQMKYNNVTQGGMLYRCTWKGNDCTYKNFTTKLTDMGLCYTFNSGENMTIRKVKGPGKYFGLHLRMSIEQDEYIGHLAFSAGLRVRIHDPDEPPLVSSLGFAVMPNSHVFASISRQRTISLKSPYKTMCEDKKLPGIKSYTIAACHDKCKENYIAENCGCQAFYMKDTRYKQCTVRQYFDCVIPLEGNASASTKNCQCTEPCDTTKYSAYLSYGAFPSKEASRAYANNSTVIMEDFKKNMLAIDLFYEDLNYHVIKQVPAYSLQNLLGEIGGLMGLFLGASILTVFEFLDVIIMVILTRTGVHKHNVSRKSGSVSLGLLQSNIQPSF